MSSEGHEIDKAGNEGEKGDYYDETGDIVLISSDGKLFRTHLYHLLSASPVFRDMEAISNESNDTPAELSLSDPDIETSTVPTMLLRLYPNHPELLEQRIDISQNLLRLVPAISFLRKYGMQRELDLIRLNCHNRIQAKTSPLASFIVGAILRVCT